MARYLYQVHIADGFVDDCEELIQRCNQVEILTYSTFVWIWKDMNFGNVYQGRTMGIEVAELSEELILIAKRFMLANSSNYEEQVAGLFLVYGLINLQPFPGFASLRLIPDDVPAIGRLEMVARKDRRLDVLYILGQVLIKGPVQYAATEREYGFEASYRKYHEGLKIIDMLGVRPMGLFRRQNEELDALREIRRVAELYKGVKKQITEDKPDRNLNYTDDKVFDEVDASLKQLLNGDYELAEENEYCQRSNRLYEIRKRAMINKVDTIKHLSGVEDRSKKTKGKNKNQESPKKRRRRRIRAKGKGKGKGKRSRKAATCSSDSEESDLYEEEPLSPASDEEMDSMPKEEPMELDLSKLKESNLPEAIKHIICEEPIEVEVPLSDSLPTILSLDPSKTYEIQVIDNYKKIDDEPIDNDELPLSEIAKPLQERKVNLSNTTYLADKIPESQTGRLDEQLFKRPLTRQGQLAIRKKYLYNKPLEPKTLRRLGLRSIANLDTEGDSQRKTKGRNSNKE